MNALQPLGYIDTAIVLAFLLATLIVGLRAGRKIKTMSEYAIANKTFGMVPLALTFMATMVGGGTVGGNVANAFSDGIILGLLPIGFCIALFFMARFVAPTMAYFDGCISTGDVMERLYNTQTKIASGIIGFLLSIVAVTAQVLALSFVCRLLPGVSQKTAILVSGLMVVLYSMKGGVKAVTKTDMIQFGALAVSIPIVGYLIVHKVGGLPVLLNALPPEKLTIWGHEKLDYYLVLAFVWGVLPTRFVAPPMVQRMLMAQSKRQLTSILFISIGFLIIVKFIIISTALGISVLNPSLHPNEAVPYLINDVLPVFFKGIVVAGIFAVVMSTADSYLNSTGIVFIHDVVKPFVDKKGIKMNELKVTKYATLVIGIGAIILAFHANDIMKLFFYGVSTIGGLITIPFLAGVLGLKVHPKQFFVSLTISVTTFLIAILAIDADHRYFVPLLCILANGISFFATHLLQNGGRFVIVDRESVSDQLTYMGWQEWKQALISAIPTPKNIMRYATRKVKIVPPQYITMAITCLISYMIILYAFAGQPIPYQTLVITILLIAGILATTLLMKHAWPSSYQQYFPIFWHFSLLYCLPMVASLLYLLMGGSIPYFIGLTIALILLLLFSDSITFVLLSTIGLASSIGLYHWILNLYPLSPDMLPTNTSPLIYINLAAIPVGFIIARQREKFTQKAIKQKEFIGRTIIHEVSNDIAPLFGRLQMVRYALTYILKSNEKLSETMHSELKDHLEHMYIDNKQTNSTLQMMQAAIKTTIGEAPDIAIYSCKELVEYCIKEVHCTPSQRANIKLDLLHDFPIRFSQVYLKHIFLNLFRNAYKYGGPDVTMKVWTSADNRLYVRDNGAGVAPKDVAHIFDPYFTKSKEGQEKGSGIGLSFCKKIMETFGGSMSCHSQQKKDKDKDADKETYTELIMQFPPVEKQMENPEEEE